MDGNGFPLQELMIECDLYHRWHHYAVVSFNGDDYSFPNDDVVQVQNYAFEEIE